MARLILSLDGQVLAEYNMSKERYTIGRLPDNDVRIDNPAVSGHHSLIINILNDSFLEDLNSTNGTYVNGKLIKKHALQHGDVITIGHHQLRFSDQQTNDTEQDEFEKTMVIPAGQQNADQLAAAEKAAEKAAEIAASEAPAASLDREDLKVDMPGFGTATAAGPATRSTTETRTCRAHGNICRHRPEQCAQCAATCQVTGTQWFFCRSRTRADQSADDAWSSWRTGRCDHPTCRRLFYRARGKRRGRRLSVGEWSADRRAGDANSMIMTSCN